MGQILKGALSLIGLGGSAPTTSAAPAKELSNDASEEGQEQSALYATAGGGAGQQLTDQQVKKQRSTIFGN